MAPAPSPPPVTERRGNGALPFVAAAALVALYVRDLNFSSAAEKASAAAATPPIPTTLATPTVTVFDDTARSTSASGSVFDNTARSTSSSGSVDDSQEHLVPDLSEDEEGFVVGGAPRDEEGFVVGGAPRDLRFSFCRSWSYGKEYQRMGKVIVRVFPDLRVSGGNHPLPPLQQVVATVLQYLLYAAVAYTFAAQMVFRMLGREEPKALADLRENKLVLVVGYLGLNMLVGHLSSTGAFEITLGQTRLWSKLETGRAPSVLEVAERIVAAGVEPDLEAAAAMGLPLGGVPPSVAAAATATSPWAADGLHHGTM